MASYSQTRTSYTQPISSEWYHAHGYPSPTFSTDYDSALPYSNNPAHYAPSAPSTYGSLDEIYLTSPTTPACYPISVPQSQQQHRHSSNGGRHQSNSQKFITLNHSPQPRHASHMDSKNFPAVSSRHGPPMITRDGRNESWYNNETEGDCIGTPDLIRTPSTSTIDSNSPTYNNAATNGRHSNRQNSNDTSSQASSSPPKMERKYCMDLSCRNPETGLQRSFSRTADLLRHIKSTHTPVYMDCPFPKCDRVGLNGFPRKDHLIEHRRGYHNDNIPKRGAGGEMRESTVGNGRHEKRGAY